MRRAMVTPSFPAGVDCTASLLGDTERHTLARLEYRIVGAKCVDLAWGYYNARYLVRDLTAIAISWV